MARMIDIKLTKIIYNLTVKCFSHQFAKSTIAEKKIVQL